MFILTSISSFRYLVRSKPQNSDIGSLFPQRLVLKGNFPPLLMLVFLPLGSVTIKSGSLKSNQSHCQFLFLNIQLPIVFYSS